MSSIQDMYSSQKVVADPSSHSVRINPGNGFSTTAASILPDLPAGILSTLSFKGHWAPTKSENPPSTYLWILETATPSLILIWALSSRFSRSRRRSISDANPCCQREKIPERTNHVRASLRPLLERGKKVMCPRAADECR